MDEKIIDVSGVSKRYSVGDRQISVLKDVSLTIHRGEFVIIAGASGSGKSTLLSLLSGLDQVSSGDISIQGHLLNGMAEAKLAPLRNQLMGFVFQSFHLIPSLNALENVMFPSELQKDPGAQDKAEELLKKVGLWDRRNSMPEQLSGGEKQRVAICRALINKPLVIFADEPTGNLDSTNSREILELMMSLRDEYGATMVMATHSNEIIAQADRVYRLHDGVLSVETTN
ncbi:MAG: ABC transporter ATP-binding protein [Desulfobulbaceae bacterium]|nr:MAG: ABC transporter ATP-binding protein [Desulfobulbaceae bacterium]